MSSLQGSRRSEDYFRMKIAYQRRGPKIKEHSLSTTAGSTRPTHRSFPTEQKRKTKVLVHDIYEIGTRRENTLKDDARLDD